MCSVPFENLLNYCVFQAYLSAMKSQWLWIKQLIVAFKEHYKVADTYHQVWDTWNEFAIMISMYEMGARRVKRGRRGSPGRCQIGANEKSENITDGKNTNNKQTKTTKQITQIYLNNRKITEYDKQLNCEQTLNIMLSKKTAKKALLKK